MDYDIKTIKHTMISAKQGRNKRIKEYLDLYNLVDPQASQPKNWFEHGVINYPQVACNLAMHMTSDGALRVRLAISNENLEERDKLSKAERALVGIIKATDEMERNSGGVVTRRRGNAMDLIIKGSFYNLVCVAANDDSAPLFTATRWEPESCYPEYGNRGMRRFVHEYLCPVNDYEEKVVELGLTRIDLPAKTTHVKVTDFYEKRRENKKDVIYHAMLANDQVVMDMDYAGGGDDVFHEIPVKGGAVSTYKPYYTDVTVDTNQQSQVSEYDRSFLEAMEKPINDMNRIYSYLLESARRQIKGFVVITTARNVKAIDADKLLEEDFTVEKIMPGEKIESIKFVEGFPEMSSLLAIPSGDMQRAAFTHTLWGGVAGQDLSGYAISQLIMGTLANLGPYHNFLNSIDSDICRLWLYDYKRGDFKPIRFATQRKEKGQLTGFIHEEFKREDVPEYLFVEVSKPLALPSNLIQKLSAMSMALPGQQLLDLTTALDEIGEFEDPELIRSRIVEDTAQRMLMPLEVQLKMLQKADQLEAQGDENSRKLAIIIRQQAQAMLTQGQNQGTPTRQRLPRPEAGGLQSQSPSEDEMMSMMGSAPTRPTRPRGVRERMANMGIDRGA